MCFSSRFLHIFSPFNCPFSGEKGFDCIEIQLTLLRHSISNMFSFADKLKPFFSITSSWDGPRSPDPLTHLPPSTQLHQKKYSETDLISTKSPLTHSISHSLSNTDFTSNSSPIQTSGVTSDAYDSTANTLAIRSLLTSYQLSLRVLVMQQPRNHRPPVILFDACDMTSPCSDCIRAFYPEQMSEIIFGNCYMSTISSGLKQQTLHENCTVISRVICHNASHLVKSNNSSMQLLFSKSSTQNSECGRIKAVRCKTATTRSNVEKEIHLSSKPLSSSLDSKRPNPLYSSPGNSEYSLDSLGLEDTNSSSPAGQGSAESLTSPQKLVSKTRRLAIVLIFHEKDESITSIDEVLQSNFLSLENSINTLADNIYDVVYSTTELSFRPSLAVAVEEFLTDVSAQLCPVKAFSYTPLQLYNFTDCPVKRIPIVISNLHQHLNSFSYMENFFSRLLTAFLTFHHSWLVSMIQHANSSDNPIKLSSHIDGLASHYGYTPTSPFLIKVLLIDQYNQFSQELLSQLVILFSYLFRYQIDTQFNTNRSASPNRDSTPLNEDFLIISMDTDIFNSSTHIKPEANTTESNIQCYTYNPADDLADLNTNTNRYKQVPFANDTIFTDILEENLVSQNLSILNYASSDRNEAIWQSLSELKHIYSHLESKSMQQELFPSDDHIYETDDAIIPPPTLIIADLNELTVEVIHNDWNMFNKDTVMTTSRPQKHSRLVHRLVEMISEILQPVNLIEEEEIRKATEVLNCEIALVCLENLLEDLHMKAELIVKHLKSWLEWEQGIEDRARTHDLFSELIALLRVDVSDLELLLRIAYVVAPEERNTLERLITFIPGY